MEHEVEAGEVEGPPSLFCTFNEVPPLLKSSDDCQHFLVVDLVVPFDGS